MNSYIVIQQETDSGCQLVRINLCDLQTVITNCCGATGTCQTVWAKDPNYSTCFLDIPNVQANRWGWANGPYTTATFANGGSVVLDLIRGAGGCTGGTQVGTVTVTQPTGPTGPLHFSFSVSEGFCLCTAASTYVGNNILPCQGNSLTVAPGQFPYQNALSGCTVADYDVAIIANCGSSCATDNCSSDNIYIALHTGA
jgi:hypothetical protein